MPEQNPNPQFEAIPPKRKGKEVVLGEAEVPTRKKLHTDCDSSSVVNFILAMAKAFTPPSHQTLSPIISPPIPDSSPHTQGPSIAVVGPELVHITNSAEGEEASP